MGWRIEFAASAEKELAALDAESARRILRFLHERIAPVEDPRTLGAALRGPKLGRFWKYRVGAYRIIASIEDRHLVVHVVRVAHRSKIYK